ncbi:MULTISPECIES: LysE family translocator [unclassified Klebsiella]|uniref:LysE family translocator n=1 Tax=Enterobacteriaceae TaxID=543 RepID=UPI0015DC766D|nr:MULTISPECIES: LysE family translocator [unclassified Klebsiella]HAT3954396.1 LysE family translocator [Kluyvera ascorbata]BBR57580.1 lysine transporter LysE [Klebsiella sp. WP4-W18-ESBL-05]BBS90348.1 lysine transporter LysE [Klebsiella sp. WP7-S18-CRE-02]BBS95371.1 lysine transporter LysE [Klebsiella sp. WP7-S18-CRE-03]BBT00403.1 lysine transporter LysE [Klebsiella sp. WP7-S18-ESBL-04]
MAMSFVAGFWLVSFLLIVTPGADWAYTISAGIHGQRIVPAVAGLISGHLLATLVVVAGVGVLIAGHPMALTAITLLGAAYLLWLGIALLRRPATISSARQLSGGWNQWALKGLCISGLNPKVFLLFLALLPQFTDPHGQWPVALQMSALGLMHLITCTLIYLLVGYGSRALLASRPQAARVVSRLSGGLMVIIAAILLVEQLR